MYLLALGLILVALKVFGYSSVADWDWWKVLTPFALTVAWWAWADASGYTKRKEMRKMEDIKKERLLKQRDALKSTVRRK